MGQKLAIETMKMWCEFMMSSEANGVASEIQAKEETKSPTNGTSQSVSSILYANLHKPFDYGE